MISMNKAADLNTIEFGGFLPFILKPQGIISGCLQVQQDMFLTVLFIFFCDKLSYLYCCVDPRLVQRLEIISII